MGIYQQNLPQLHGKICITDGGMETDLCFNKQINLPEFAAYDLLRNEEGYQTLYDYYKSYAELAGQFKLGLILETPTWRANADWGRKIGDSLEVLHQLNLKSVKLIEHIRDEYESEDTPIIISGCMGPRGDGYTPKNMMTAQQALDYHSNQIASFAETNVDMVTAMTLNYIDESIGVVLAAKEYGFPACISFTVETDGKLPTGETLEYAITTVDKETGGGPVYYMINCAHPTHFNHLFSSDAGWLARLRGVRANASCLSHAELDESEFLDDGNPLEFGSQLVNINAGSPGVTVLGGCCGTDLRHIEAICHNISVNPCEHELKTAGQDG